MKRVSENVLAFSGVETDNGLLLKSEDDHITVEFDAKRDGYYTIELTYFHEETEALLKGETTYPDGETLLFFEGLPHGSTRSLINIFFKKGKNTIFLRAPWEEVVISGMNNLGIKEDFEYEVSPKTFTYFCDSPKVIKSMLKNYRKDILEVKTETGIKIPFMVSLKGNEETTASFVDVTLDAETVAGLGEGERTLIYCLDGGIESRQSVVVRKTTPKTEFKIISLDVGCANATLLMLPNGKNMLVDSSTKTGARDVVIPYLEKHSIKLDYYLLTHFHGDHSGLKDEILEKYRIEKPEQEKVDALVKADKESRENYLKGFGYLDSTMLCFYDRIDKIWDLGGVKIEVLNSRYYEDGNPLKIYRHPFVKNNEYNYENTTSVSFILDYNGFRYYHGADNYASAQNRQIADFAKMGREDELRCHYFYGNHHFICDTSMDFVKTLNPYFVFVPSDISLHCRSTYHYFYKRDVENYHFCNKRLLDTLIGGEVGNVRVCVNDAEDWYCETNV